MVLYRTVEEKVDTLTRMTEELARSLKQLTEELQKEKRKVPKETKAIRPGPKLDCWSAGDDNDSMILLTDIVDSYDHA